MIFNRVDAKKAHENQKINARIFIRKLDPIADRRKWRRAVPHKTY